MFFGQEVKFIFHRKISVDHRLPRRRVNIGDQFWQFMISLRPHHNINPWGAAADLFAFGLRDTAGHRNENTTAIRTQSLLLYLTQAAQFRVDFFGCFFSNMAGV